MSDLTLWTTFIAIGLGTFAIRLCFIELHGKWRVPALFTRALAYVPASVMAALALPAVVYPAGQPGGLLDNPQVPAAILAALVAWKTRSTVATLAVGMAALWGLQYLA
ncbi:AzlD domain-containing protein [Pseudomonas sp. DTU_2021_1001937_2_SI_NGA_ILE_001]|uniref:AzlD domain-containing protein n=1 Tax=Pseudomonas sp. DTU_2021_1001937_2_SI_NGA_ILE_001 TaxID=3077589 RepID=UPI0028FC2DF0|nr:AzlD domain-containing protein [Pseudomonas sp. DTU_2021_1001937_2_SI_NGA_ILE_001]WNW09807.1 AzlD domain-containing protein [Pseudomonas sp. DTU_2021_1001937_2_SI_NGA_ILE_001]